MQKMTLQWNSSPLQMYLKLVLFHLFFLNVHFCIIYLQLQYEQF